MSVDAGSVTTNTTNATAFTTDTPGAQEPAAQANGNSDKRIFTQADIEAARTQEKDKMYKRLETLQETVQRLEAEAKQRAEIEESQATERRKAQERAEADERARQESEMSVKELLAKREAEWNQQLQQVQQQVEAERALREREQQFAELMEIRQNIMVQYQDRIAPELMDMVGGDTPEELQQSADDLAARTERILSQTAEAMQYARQQTPTSRVTAPSSGDNSGSQRVPTPEEIRDMSMKEYAKHRRTLLGGGADGPRNRGMFG